jgi:hypothetical protein
MFSSTAQQEIGYTYYDLQTNRSQPKRLTIKNDNSMAATWTGSSVSTQGAPDRGSFYNYFDGTTWNTAPDSRIEDERTGWPAHTFTRNGEVVIAHNALTRQVICSRRNTVNSGEWTSNSIGNVDGIWPRVASVGDTVYTIYCQYTASEETDSYFLYFARSIDAGITWDTLDVLLPGISDSTFNSMRSDAYSIEAKDSIVAIVGGGQVNPLILWKSTDFGETFNSTVIIDIPETWKSFSRDNQIDSELTDTLLTSLGHTDILIDHNGEIHVFSALTNVINARFENGITYSYFPNTMQMGFWKETSGLEVQDLFYDINNDGVNGSSENPYNTHSITNPSAAIDNEGKIYFVYTMRHDESEYSDIYGMVSMDNGDSWEESHNLTKNATYGVENYYPSLAKDVINGKIHMIWQQDSLPGLQFGEQPVRNSIMYQEFSLEDFTTTDGNITAQFDYDVTGLGNNNCNLYRSNTDEKQHIDQVIWKLNNSVERSFINLKNESNYNVVLERGIQHEVCLLVQNKGGSDTSCLDILIPDSHLYYDTLNNDTINLDVTSEYFQIHSDSGLVYLHDVKNLLRQSGADSTVYEFYHYHYSNVFQDTTVITIFDTIAVIDTTISEVYDTISISIEDTLNITLSISTDLEEIEDELKIWSDGSSIYFESSNQEGYAFELISITGSQVLDVDDTSVSNSISLNGLTEGTYIAKFTSLSDPMVSTTKKIVLR